MIDVELYIPDHELWATALRRTASLVAAQQHIEDANPNVDPVLLIAASAYLQGASDVAEYFDRNFPHLSGRNDRGTQTKDRTSEDREGPGPKG